MTHNAGAQVEVAPRGTLSRAQIRNGAIRSALRDAFPGVKFGVRNGPDGHASVVWVDGPVRNEVFAVVRAVPADEPGRPWAAVVTRRVTVTLLAVSYLRAHASGRRYYEERDRAGKTVPPGTILPAHQRLASCTHCDDDLDAATITDDERRSARVLVSLAGVDAGGDAEQVVEPEREFEVRQHLGHALYHHAAALDAVLVEP